MERDAAIKLAYFLNLLRPHLPPENRFTAESCRFVTVSVIAAVHVVRFFAYGHLQLPGEALHCTLLHTRVSYRLRAEPERLCQLCACR